MNKEEEFNFKTWRNLAICLFVLFVVISIFAIIKVNKLKNENLDLLEDKPYVRYSEWERWNGSQAEHYSESLMYENTRFHVTVIDDIYYSIEWSHYGNKTDIWFDITCFLPPDSRQLCILDLANDTGLTSYVLEGEWNVNEEASFAWGDY